MKTKHIFIIILIIGAAFPSHAQIPVTDGANIAQSIVNSIQQLAQTSTTAQNMVKNFQETVKIYKQGKEFYDALKSVNNLVKDARKVQKTILMIGEISDIYVDAYKRMLSDKNYTVDELTAIAWGYSQLIQESTDALTELKNVINVNGLSMSDKERLDIIDRVYNTVSEYKNLVSYYTKKNIAASYFRSAKKGETAKFLSLYGNSNDRYW